MKIKVATLKINLLALLSVGLVAIAVTGCGQKSELYLPDSKTMIKGGEEAHEKDVFLIPAINERIEKMQENQNDY